MSPIQENIPSDRGIAFEQIRFPLQAAINRQGDPFAQIEIILIVADSVLFDFWVAQRKHGTTNQEWWKLATYRIVGVVILRRVEDTEVVIEIDFPGLILDQTS